MTTTLCRSRRISSSWALLFEVRTTVHMTLDYQIIGFVQIVYWPVLVPCARRTSGQMYVPHCVRRIRQHGSIDGVSGAAFGRITARRVDGTTFGAGSKSNTELEVI